MLCHICLAVDKITTKHEELDLCKDCLDNVKRV